MNYHESEQIPLHSSSVKRFGLGIECLALSTLSTNGAEALNPQLLPRRHDCIDPALRELLEKRLALCVLLLANNLATTRKNVYIQSTQNVPLSSMRFAADKN